MKPYSTIFLSSYLLLILGGVYPETTQAQVRPPDIIFEGGGVIEIPYVRCDPSPTGNNNISSEVTHPASLTCQDGKIDLTIEGGFPPYEVTWVDRNDTELINTTTESGTDPAIDLDGYGIGSYTVTITDALLGNTTLTFFLFSGPSNGPISLIRRTNPLQCYDSETSSNDGEIEISIDFDGIENISWSGPNGFSSNSLSIQNLDVGTYTIIVQTEDGCQFSKSYELCCCEDLGDNENPTIAGTAGNTSKSNKASRSCTENGVPTFLNVSVISLYSPADASSYDGSISLDIQGPGDGLAIVWTGPNNFTSNSASIRNLTVGEYCVSVSDGCTNFNRCYELVDCSISAPSVEGVSLRTCPGVSVGAIQLEVTGEHSPYTYEWNDGSQQRNRQLLEAGTYCVIVTDSKGCRSERQCFVIGEEDLQFTPISGTNTCGTNVTCRNIPVDFIPYTGGLDCAFDDRESCRILNCYCPLTGGLVASEDRGYIGVQFDPDNCELIGFCPEGGTEIAERGNFDSQEILAWDPTCGNCLRLVCVRQDFCLIAGQAVLLGEQIAGPASISFDESCNVPGNSGCRATCASQSICLANDIPLGCNPGRAINENYLATKPDHLKENVADIILRSFLTNELSLSVEGFYLPEKIGLESPISDFYSFHRSNGRKAFNVVEYEVNMSELFESANYIYSFDDQFLHFEPKETLQSSTDTKFHIFPNPTTDEIIIRISDDYLNEELVVKIMTLTGTEILSQKIIRPQALGNVNIDARPLKTGAYMLSISTQRKRIFSEIITKIK